MLFRNKTHQEIWVNRWCRTCFEPHEAARRLQGKDTVCPILNKALTSGRKPKEWDRAIRDTTMENSIKCNSYAPKPPKPKQDKHFDDVLMFDVEPHEAHMVPVEGWPDRPVKDGEVDHA